MIRANRAAFRLIYGSFVVWCPCGHRKPHRASPTLDRLAIFRRFGDHLIGSGSIRLGVRPALARDSQFFVHSIGLRMEELADLRAGPARVTLGRDAAWRWSSRLVAIGRGRSIAKSPLRDFAWASCGSRYPLEAARPVQGRILSHLPHLRLFLEPNLTYREQHSCHPPSFDQCQQQNRFGRVC